MHPPRGLSALCYEEPFRVFFPLGAVLALVGVSLWPLFYFGARAVYPGISHARLMIEGFVASFIIGFLGTAGPRVTSSFPFSRAEFFALLSLDVFAAGLHFSDANGAGDLTFCAMLLLLIIALGIRFSRRHDTPPRTFVLVALGLITGAAGAALVGLNADAQYSRAYQLGDALLSQCFPLLPVMGVAPFFVLRLLDAADSGLPQRPPPPWRSSLAFPALAGLLVVGTYVADPLAVHFVSGWLRTAIVALYFAVQMPWRSRTFLADCLRSAIAAIVLGLVLMSLLPVYRIGALHVVLISGITFLIFTVATRVIFGHSGDTARFERPLLPLVFAGILLLLATGSRLTADLAPAARAVHLIAAALCWLAGALIWMFYVLPRVTVVEPEENSASFDTVASSR